MKATRHNMYATTTVTVQLGNFKPKAEWYWKLVLAHNAFNIQVGSILLFCLCWLTSI